YIRAAEVTANLKDGENGTHVPIPTSEYQVRALAPLTPGGQRKAWEIATEKAADPSVRQVRYAAYLVWRESNPIPKANIEITSKQPPPTFEERCEFGWLRIIPPAVKSVIKGFEPPERQAVWEFLARKLTERTNYRLAKREHNEGRMECRSSGFHVD